jgi:hypothetical protein
MSTADIIAWGLLRISAIVMVCNLALRGLDWLQDRARQRLEARLREPPR